MLEGFCLLKHFSVAALVLLIRGSNDVSVRPLTNSVLDDKMNAKHFQLSTRIKVPPMRKRPGKK